MGMGIRPRSNSKWLLAPGESCTPCNLSLGGTASSSEKAVDPIQRNHDCWKKKEWNLAALETMSGVSFDCVKWHGPMQLWTTINKLHFQNYKRQTSANYIILHGFYQSWALHGRTKVSKFIQIRPKRSFSRNARHYIVEFMATCNQYYITHPLPKSKVLREHKQRWTNSAWVATHFPDSRWFSHPWLQHKAACEGLLCARYVCIHRIPSDHTPTIMSKTPVHLNYGSYKLYISVSACR